MITTNLLDYYREQSILTDPGKYTHLYQELPRDIPGLVKVIQGLIITPYSGTLRNLYYIDPEQIDNAGLGVRRTEDLLERVLSHDDAPLTVERPLLARVGMTCRNFAVLLVSMLRYQGIPARARVGFGSYFDVPYAADHRVAEYWNAEQERWIMVDPMLDEIQQKANNLTFDLLDIRAGDPFLQSGEVWQKCRAGELNPLDFGDALDDLGMPPIRYALLHDFVYLNKLEVLGGDDWGELITKPDKDLTLDDFALLDQIATLTAHVDAQFAPLRSLFAETVYGQVVRTQIETLA